MRNSLQSRRFLLIGQLILLLALHSAALLVLDAGLFMFADKEYDSELSKKSMGTLMRPI